MRKDIKWLFPWHQTRSLLKIR